MKEPANSEVSNHNLQISTVASFNYRWCVDLHLLSGNDKQMVKRALQSHGQKPQSAFP
jgi:hypothetical protein